jgi:hypothetical protein
LPVIHDFSAIKSEIIEELEKYRDEELAEQRDKRQKAAADEKAAGTVSEQAPVSTWNIYSLHKLPTITIWAY